MLAMVPFAPGQAYFASEQIGGGSFTAGELTASLGLEDSTASLGPQQLLFTSEFGLEHSALSVANEVSFRTETVGSDVFCDALRLRITRGSDITMAQANSFIFGPETGTSSLQVFTADISVLESDLPTFPHGAGCNLTLISESVQTGLLVDEGFTDVQRITWSLLAQQIVLNEVLADAGPGGGEFIELFNTGSEPVDVAGWEIAELTSSGATTSHTIVATSTNSSDLIAFNDSGSTIVPAGGYLALKFAGAASYLNNGGDTVTLFNHFGVEQDSYTYTTSLPGKSDARIPDGTGDWVDPIPTPGLPNKLEMTIEELSIGLTPTTTTSPDAPATSTVESKPQSGGGTSEKKIQLIPVIATTSVTATPEVGTTTPTTTMNEFASSTESSATNTPTLPVEEIASSSASSSVDALDLNETEVVIETEALSTVSTTTESVEQTKSEAPVEDEPVPETDIQQEEPKEEENEAEESESKSEEESEPEPVEPETEASKEEEIVESEPS